MEPGLFMLHFSSNQYTDFMPPLRALNITLSNLQKKPRIFYFNFFVGNGGPLYFFYSLASKVVFLDAKDVIADNFDYVWIPLKTLLQSTPLSYFMPTSFSPWS